jgi:spermidine synthase
MGTKVLKEVNSPVNGKIRVIRSLGFGTYIQVDNLTQSGGVVYVIWKETLKKIANSNFKINDCLILGLGGGSVAKLVRKYWPKAKVIGVDIDPVIVELGKKYLDLKGIDIVIADAKDFVKKSKNKYDLIVVDTYLGDNYPSEFESSTFLNSVTKLLKVNGLIVFNRLYFDNKRSAAVKFGKKLEGIFSKVNYFYPQANLMLICKA